MACILLVLLLCFIQYLLIQNTYSLTKEKYETEVKNAVNTSIRPYANSINSTTMNLLNADLQAYSAGQLSKEVWRRSFLQKMEKANREHNQQLLKSMQKNEILKGVSYQMQYQAVVLEHKGQKDTLLSASERPFVLTPKSFETSGSLLLSQGIQISQYGTPAYTITVKHADYINILEWKKAVIKKMAFLLAGAAGLIMAVMILLYLVFRALIRQQKIAAIREDFANNVTHELQTPLASLSLIIKSLQHANMRNDPILRTQLLESLQRQQRKLQHIVDSVLDSTVAQAGAAEKLEVSSFLERFANDYRFAGRQLLVEVSPESVWINADPIQLETVLGNLLANAFKYSVAPSPVYLQAYRDGLVYRIVVLDEGIGIDPAEQERIFDKFYRVPTPNRHDVKGIGLGLYLALQASRHLKGTLTVKSSLNKGSAFTLTLPIDEN